MKLPLYARVLIAVVLGSAVGLAMRGEAVVPMTIPGHGHVDLVVPSQWSVLGVTTADLGQLGMLVIRMLKMFAVPLVLFAILDSIVKSDELSGRSGVRLLVICLINVTVAFTIGLTLMNVFEPGLAWYGELDKLAGGLPEGRTPPANATLSPLDNFDKWIPESIAGPFMDNNVISVVLLAILAGAAIRATRRDPDAGDSIGVVVLFIEGGYRVVVRMLTWVIAIVPFAVFGIVANVVGKAGVGVFGAMWGFLLIIIAGFVLHALV
jgi:Na+/H+-dicarboxylate symporter